MAHIFEKKDIEKYLKMFLRKICFPAARKANNLFKNVQSVSERFFLSFAALIIQPFFVI